MIAALCFAVSIKYNFEFGAYGQDVQTGICLMCIVIYAGIPLLALYNVLVHFVSLETERMKNNYGSYYDKLAVERGRIVLL